MRSVFPITRFGIKTDTFNDFDKFFNGFFEEPGYNMKKPSSSIPLANIISNDTGYIVEIAVPGFSRSDFDVTVNRNVLTVSTTSSSESSDKNFSSCEFSYSTFSRAWTLPDDVPSESISARYESGILYVDIPTIEKTNKKITVDIM